MEPLAVVLIILVPLVLALMVWTILQEGAARRRYSSLQAASLRESEGPDPPHVDNDLYSATVDVFVGAVVGGIVGFIVGCNVGFLYFCGITGTVGAFCGGAVGGAVGTRVGRLFRRRDHVAGEDPGCVAGSLGCIGALGFVLAVPLVWWLWALFS